MKTSPIVLISHFSSGLFLHCRLVTRPGATVSELHLGKHLPSEGSAQFPLRCPPWGAGSSPWALHSWWPMWVGASCSADERCRRRESRRSREGRMLGGAHGALGPVFCSQISTGLEVLSPPQASGERLLWAPRKQIGVWSFRKLLWPQW